MDKVTRSAAIRATGLGLADMTAAQASSWGTTDAARWRALIVDKRIVAP